MRQRLFLVISVLTLAISAVAQTRNTDNTLKLDEGRSIEKTSIADMAWLAGNWTGRGLGGVSEELWSKPNGGVMMGSYRLIKDGKPVFYEMLLMMEVEGTLVLRIKHFHPNFVGWEEKDKTVDFKFVKKDGNRMYFSGLTFEQKSRNELNIYLALRSKDGNVREEAFLMKRVD